MLQATPPLISLLLNPQGTVWALPARDGWTRRPRGMEPCPPVSPQGGGCRARCTVPQKESSLSSLFVFLAPKVKRPKLDAVKRLNFGSSTDIEELPIPSSPPQDITPPPSPKVPAELWGYGYVCNWGGGLGTQGLSDLEAEMSLASVHLRSEELWSLSRSPDAGADLGVEQALPPTRNPVLRRPPIREDFINVTSTGGDRAFLVLRDDPLGTGVQVGAAWGPHCPAWGC